MNQTMKLIFILLLIGGTTEGYLLQSGEKQLEHYVQAANCSYVRSDHKTISCGDNVLYDEDTGPQFLSGHQWTDIMISCFLVLLAGVMSGLTMGLMSMDPMNLKILVKSASDPKDRLYAQRILPLVKRHHLLLVTLLLGNAVCMEALPLFLDRLAGPLAAILISTTAVLAFGEIIPQAICTRFGLAIGGHAYWFVWILIAILSPISWPISKLLDCVLGTEEQTLYRRAELKELVGYHGIGADLEDEEEGRGSYHSDDSDASNSDPHSWNEDRLPLSETPSAHLSSSHNSITNFVSSSSSSSSSKKSRETLTPRDNHDKLTKDEVRIIKGALDLRDKTVSNAMTPMSKCFTLPYSSKMDFETMTKIFESGHSRIPIWREDEDDIIGMILVKQLILLSPINATPLSSLHIHRLPMISSTMSLYQLLNIFQTGRSHLAVVVDPRDHITPLGVITLEDVIEELIQGEILDETDRYLDMRRSNEPGQLRRGRSRTFSLTASIPDPTSEHSTYPFPSPTSITPFSTSTVGNVKSSPSRTSASTTASQLLTTSSPSTISSTGTQSLPQSQSQSQLQSQSQSQHSPQSPSPMTILQTSPAQIDPATGFDHSQMLPPITITPPSFSSQPPNIL